MSHRNELISNLTFARLSYNVAPIHYKVYLKPCWERLEFKGKVDIDIRIYANSREVVLHSEELEIYDVKLKRDDDSPTYFQSTVIIYDHSTNLTSLLFDETLVKGSKMVLSMEFKGNIDPNETYGLFRSQLIDDQVTKDLLMTNLARNYARRLLPCWDEPEFKATFQVSLEVPKRLTALSNSEIEKVKTKRNGNKEVHFKRTPSMPTYLLAIGIGELHYIEDEYKSVLNEKPVKCRVYSLREPNDAMKFILETAIKSLEYFERQFDIPYKLPKLDLVMVPGLDWPMENWGLITLSDKLELDSDSSDSLIVAAREVAHEIAHQWFGNLVTIRWWSDLWLKEGFAVYFELLAIDSIYPEFKVKSDFYNYNMLRLLSMEDDEMTPLTIAVTDPRKMDKNFIETIYVKGAIVLNMINQTLSNHKFRRFIQSYLKKYQYGIVSISDFYSELIIVSNGGLEVFFDTWVRRKERPYLCVTEGKGSKPNEGFIIITQKITNSELDQNLFWPMPIKIVIFTSSKEYRTTFLKHRSTRISIKKDEPYLIYPDENSYYRIQYSKPSILKLKPYFQDRSLSVQERSRLMDDAGVLFSKTYNSFPLLDILPLYLNEDDNDVMCDINVHTNALFSFWSNIPEFTHDLEKIKRKLYISLYNKKSLQENMKDTNLNPNLQLYVMRNLVLLGNDTILHQAETLFQEFKYDRTILNPESQLVIFAALISIDNPYNLNQLVTLYSQQSDSDPQGLRNTIVTSLSSAHINLLPTILEWSLTNHQLFDLYDHLQYSISQHQSLALDFLLLHWSSLHSFYSTTDLNSILIATTSWLSTSDDVTKLQHFFENDDRRGVEIGEIVNAIERRAKVMLRDREKMGEAIDELVKEWGL